MTTLRQRVTQLNATRRVMIARLNQVNDLVTNHRFHQLPVDQQRDTLTEMGRIADLGRTCLDRIARIRGEHRHLPPALRTRLDEEVTWLTSTTAMADRYAARAGEV